MILKQYLGDYNKEIYGRNIVNKVALSQKAIALTLDELEKEGILKSRKQGNIKYFKLNIPNPNTKDLLSSAEMLNKTIFFNLLLSYLHPVPPPSQNSMVKGF